MSFTAADEKRMYDLEEHLNRFSHLMKGAGSKNELNRLLVLCEKEVDNLESIAGELDTKLDVLIALAQKLQ